MPRPQPLGRLGIAFAVTVAVAHIWANAFATLPELQAAGFHFGLFAVLCVLLFPASKTRWLRVAIDGTIAVAALAAAIYLYVVEDALYERGVEFIQSDWVAASVAILIVLELARRTTGWTVPILTALALTYVVLWGPLVPGAFSFAGLSWETLLFRSYFGTDGMFGPIARISWTFVFMFILLGAFLVRSGAGDFILALARAAAGRITGGPGIVAILGSGLMGSITGSAVANTVSTGVITIPLMKRAGFPPKFAGGVEAAASTGGQLMPPVMGAGAFVMASFTQISYLEIIAVSVLPALLYFFTVGVFVRIEAARIGLVPSPDVEPLWPVIKAGWHFLLPIAALAGLLIAGFTPVYAAAIAIAVTVAASWLSPNPMRLRDIVGAASDGAVSMAPTAMLLICVGLIVNVVGMTGVGNTFSLMLSSWAGGSLLLTIILVALASLVLGMGLPVTASYIVLATLSAPAIYGLMVEAELVTALMQGASTPELSAYAMLVAPELVTSIGNAMSEADALTLLAALPADIRSGLAEGLIAPALLTSMLLAAHLVIFWLSQDSNVTPPVALCAFAAASIAGTRPMETGFAAWKIAKGLYLVPLLFVYQPLITGTGLEPLVTALMSVSAFTALAAALHGYFAQP
ncbi:MAG: TRAP transporter fused permease subunit, partial [Pseudomonadota bacterium]